MIKSLLCATAVAGVVAIAGCAGTQSAQSSHPRASSAASADVTSEPTPAATPSQPPPPLTKAQAAAAYTRIMDPSNRLADTVNTDFSDGVPFSQIRSDTAKYVAAMQKATQQLQAVRWPARVQPYVTAMMLTDFPATIRCAEAEERAGSTTAANDVSYSNQDCLASGSRNNASQIRQLLDLPAPPGA